MLQGCRQVLGGVGLQVWIVLYSQSPHAFIVAMHLGQFQAVARTVVDVSMVVCGM